MTQATRRRSKAGASAPWLAGVLLAGIGGWNASAQQAASSAPAARPAARAAAMPAAQAAPAAGQAADTPSAEQARLMAQGRQVDQLKQTMESQIQELGSSGSSSGGGGVALAGDKKPSVAPLIQPSQSIYAGEAVVRRVPGALRRIAVGDGEVLSVFSVGKSELVMIGTKPGNTNVHLWMADGSQRDVSVTVTGSKSDGVAETVRELLGDTPGITVRAIGANVVISGNDVDAATTAKIQALRNVYPQILNFAGPDPVGMRPMVQMDVSIMEFNKNAVEDLGIRWDSTIDGPIGGLIRDVTTNNYFRVLPKDNETFNDVKDRLPTRLSGPQGYFGIATTIASKINLLMSRGKAWVLAQPKLSAKSGSNATFLVGGEVPIVVPSILGQTQIEYKEYGIRLNINPSVNSSNQVNTSIMAEVSRIDPSVSVQGVPGFLTRRVETEINVDAGQTIVISGLLDREASKAVDKLPLLGDIPILGKLFRSDGFRGNKTELVIFVTPRIVSPTSPENLQDLQRAQGIEKELQDEISPRQDKLIK
ncbi:MULTISPECIES: type II and III secretion system protein family protein [Xanthomonas]|uniref:type II and III secretion system protein family protein n=1 Tax=Xanthomonas TaxID=338 RepID=UPI001FD52BBC|nr:MULTISPECIES: pilus assembly protein N-terminal domain-containing protein [unclassified Xanthomonas]WNH45205.1 pilus assembly protein N-terminal domain-containing protein [Xanthomonas sp. A6251]